MNGPLAGMCLVLSASTLLAAPSARGGTVGGSRERKRALIVVTSHSVLGKTGRPTGYYLPEVSHPYFRLLEAGYAVDIASPKGGEAPMDPASRDLSDPDNQKMLAEASHRRRLERTAVLRDVLPGHYDAVIFAGGHGTMWDFPGNPDIERISRAIYEAGGVVAAVCHGPAALVEVKLADGNYLIAGKKVAGFSNAEEAAVNLSQVVPFSLEDRLRARGGRYSSAAVWQEHIAVDGRLVTGQNPASARAVGEAVVKVLAQARPAGDRQEKPAAGPAKPATR